MADDQATQYAMMTSGMYGPNPYTRFPQGIALSDLSYNGTPTDAMGRPIQAQPGTTLNTSPVTQPAAAPSGAGQYAMNNTLINDMPVPAGNPGGGGWGQGAQQGMYGTIDAIGKKQAAQLQNQALYGQGVFANYKGDPGVRAATAYPHSMPPLTGNMTADDAGKALDAWAKTVSYPGGGGQDGGGGGGSAAGQTSYQNALNLLSNPGKVTTPGATVPESQPVSSQPSVLDQFLKAKQGGQGAGNYSNQGFFDTLNRLRSGGLAANSGDVAQSTNLAPRVQT